MGDQVSGNMFTALCYATFDYALPLDAVRIEWLDQNFMEAVAFPPRIVIGEVQTINETTFTRNVYLDPVLVLDSGIYTCRAYAGGEFVMSDVTEVSVLLNATGENIDG